MTGLQISAGSNLRSVKPYTAPSLVREPETTVSYNGYSTRLSRHIRGRCEWCATLASERSSCLGMHMRTIL
jgi:hypothetical protein